ncbi:amidase domain-containing protein [Trichoderma breve]|uniref:Amidase domain-containing protein n=1 Tax=Trichoderma breve TaxID=2034170 RepID=A0A9W9E9T9_9HYPO|nr:amidase domain-containing protein [Trichoderma breve]KAJ4862552.1 amidase domain-containing protein [Trichoderma breve]
MASKPFNLLTSTAHDIQQLFDCSELNAESLVKQVLDQINKHNRDGLNLGALISVAPRQQLLERAQFLDQERAAGKARSLLHGIPFIVKDSIATDPQLGMGTAGSWALVGSRPSGNAPTVQKLLDAGGILIGKASLTEFNNFKGQGLIDGWSPVNGYTRSAYVRGPLKLDEGAMGHSVRSAVGVSAGFGIVSLGVETDGSIVSPASRAALYAMKPTIGTVSMDGVIPVSKSLDSVGAMARSPADLAMVIEMLQATGLNHDERLSQLMTQKWDGLRIGFVDEKIWKLPENLCKHNDEALIQMREDYHTVMKVLSDAGVHVEYPVQLPPGAYEFQQVINHYLETLNSSEVRTLKELVDWNRQHADRELPREYPSQSSLEDSLQCKISAAENAETLAFLRKLAGPDGIDRILKLFKLDAVASLADSPLSSVASAAGYPIATMPLGILDMNGRPFGISMTASKHQEKKLFQIMSAWETLGARKPPPTLMEEINQAQP